MTNELAVIEQTEEKGLIASTNLPAVQDMFQDQGTEDLLKKVREEIDKFTLDLEDKDSIKKGRSLARKIGSTKAGIDDMGKEYVAGIKSKIAIVDQERKRFRDTLDSWRDEILNPIKEHEQKEKDRIAEHNARLEELSSLTQFQERLSSKEWEDRCIRADALATQDWEEYEDIALEKHREVVETIETRIKEAEEYEAQQAELERLKREAEERAQKEREDQAAREAEAKAKEEAAQRIAEAEARAKAAEDKAEQEAKDAALKEREAIRLEAEERKRLEAARERDRQHRGKIHRNALDAIMECGADMETGKSILQAIVDGKVPNVTIRY